MVPIHTVSPFGSTAMSSAKMSADPLPPEEAEVAETLPRLSMWTILRDPNSMCGWSSDTS